MKKNNSRLCLFLLFITLLITLLSCSRQAEKPKLTISEYDLQALTSKGAVAKILSESDYKKMHEIALAVESSRAIKCISVSDECNVLSEILNKIVKATNDGILKEADNVEIYKLVSQLDEEFRIGQDKLATQWKEYINAHASDVNFK